MTSRVLIAAALAALGGKSLPLLGAGIDDVRYASGERSPQACAPGACEIVLRPVVSLTAPAGGALLPNAQVFVARDAQGRFITLNRPRDQLLVFDRDGRYQTSVGRRGRGAGEWQRIIDVHPSRGQGLLFYDVILGSLTGLNPDLTVGSRIPVSYRPAILRDDGSFVVAGQMRPPAAAGYPLHLIDSTGKVVRSFGVDAPEFRADITRLTDRRVAAAQNGGVWAVAPGRYVVERWDPNSGARQLALHVKSSWFKESTRGPAPGERPTAHIDAIWERDGHLWVLFLDVDQRWKPLPASELEKPVDPHRYNQSYDWVIEALNPATGDVVASKRFDRVMWQLSPGSLVTSLSLGSSGEVAQIDVVTAELQRKSREEH